MKIRPLGVEFYFANTWIDGRRMRVVATGFVSNPGRATETHDPTARSAGDRKQDTLTTALSLSYPVLRRKKN